ncbi:EAL domain-containing protein [uncultured Pseudacidovorax sp.]|uniref:putative bifunctional diguanylate cyclase/phosphodiesterase n=1 Tax=uncultured Pseudacidovorax sp. TaxID=679313 RepID=UPI0025CE7969|nr:EAL domain-containing protein [uncultured Pseudacidovorax sp.]
MTAPTSPPRQFAASTFALAAAFIVVVFGLAVFAVWEMRSRAIEDGREQLERFLGGSTAAINQNLLAVDLLLADLGTMLRPTGSEDIAAAGRRAASNMQSLARHSLLVERLQVLRTDGHAIVPFEAEAVRLPERFVQQLMSQPVPELMVTAPTLSPRTSQQVMYFVRVVRLPDATQGLAVAEVQVASVARLLAHGAGTDGMEVTLESRTQGLLASVPPRAEIAPEAGSLAALAATVDGRGIAERSRGRLLGQDAIVALRPTLNPDVVLTAGLPMAQVLENFATERNLIVGVAALLMLMVAGVSIYALSQLREQWLRRREALHAKSTLDQALESMSDGFVLLDADGRVAAWNRRFAELFPQARAALEAHMPMTALENVVAGRASEAETAAAAAKMAQAEPGDGGRDGALVPAAGALPAPGEQELELPDGRTVMVVKSPTPSGGMVCVYRDMSEKRRHLADMVEGKAQLQATLDALPDVLLELCLDGRCIGFHSARASLLDIGDPVGRTLAEVLPGDAAIQIMAAMREAYLKGLSFGKQFERRASQGTAWFEISASRKLVGEGPDARFIVILRDITDRMSAQLQIDHLSFYDNLTGLPNRRMLLHRLQSAIDANVRRERQAALLFLDLDHFKTLNDAQGRNAGDVLLKQVAQRLQHLMREGDTVARLGGDEFVILIEGLSADAGTAVMQTQAFGEAVLAELGRPIQLPAMTYHGTCSIGATLISAGSASLDDLLKQADIAMFHAKTAGGDVLRFFEADMQTTVNARASLESELRAALKARGQFLLHYQPQVTTEGRVVGAEVLIRWLHPQRGLIPPAAFIDVAEETGLISPIGLWALETACKQLDEWSTHPRRRHLTLAVNVSARQFRKSDFADRVREVLIRTGADPSKIKLELTESLLHDEVADTIRKMKSLAAIGISFSMDDFGTGYSSLSYMAQLPLHQIKIDKFFVSGIGTNPKIELIVQTLIGMAANLDLEVVAEGVETQAQLDFLIRNGCRVCQGFFFGRPQPVEVLEAQLDADLALAPH